MTTDLICLLILALWSIPLNTLPALARFKVAGIAWAIGNRDTSPEVAPWVYRADRAQRNHLDNLAMNATVILMAAITGQNDSITAIASIVLVAMRIFHGLIYLFGVPLVRSATYFVSVLALLVIVWRILI